MEIPKAKVSSMYRLSPMQEGMLFHNLYAPHSGAYIQQTTIDLKGVFNVQAFKDSWQWLIEKHTILRTAFFHDNLKNPVQCVFETSTMPYQHLDYSLLSAEDQAIRIQALLESDLQTPFNFNQAPLMRVTLIRLSDNCHRMIWTHHHILMDGWSSELLTEELVEAYEAYACHQNPPDKAVDCFEDYIKYIGRVEAGKAKEFWISYFDRFESHVPLPFISRNDGSEYSPSVIKNFSWDNLLSGHLEKFARKNRITVNTIVQGIWSLLLSRYISKDDVTFGATTVGRPMDLLNAEARIGLYINTLPVRVHIDDDQTITSWLSTLQEQQSKVREFQHSSLTDVQAWSGTSGALFDHIIVFDNFPKSVSTEDIEQSKALRYTHIRLSEKTSYALTIEASFGPQLDIGFLYDPKLIDPFFIDMMHKHFDFVLKQIIGEKCQLVADLRLMNSADQEELLKLGAPKERIEYHDTFIKIFESNSDKNPDAIAAIHNDRKLTYKELNEKANQLAAVLKSCLKSAQELIPVIGDRSENWLITMIAIFKSNCIYVPLHPEYPDERIITILSDCNTSIVIATEDEINKKRSWLNQFQKIIISSDSFKIVSGVNQLPLLPCSPSFPQFSDLAYVIYTSGSTGKPKGVMIEHGGMLNHLYAKVNDLQITSQSNVAQNASQTFDISIWQFLSPLLVGGRVTIIDNSLLFNLSAFLDSIQSNHITILEVVPSYLNAVLDETIGIENRLDQLKYLIVTGERLQKSLVSKWFLKGYTIPIVNAYGPTEASDDITHSIIKKNPKESRVFLGNAIQNLNIYILNNNFHPVPVGVPGEICVSGIGVGQGYLNDVENTFKRFCKDPFSNQNNKLYRTGDLGKWTLDGKLDFLGRVDEQIKIRGFRIELGEIEVVLRAIPSVKDCAVIAVNGESADKTLLACLTTEPDYDQTSVDNYLRQYLPDYMMPSQFILVDELPLTTNGKIDKRKLQVNLPQSNKQQHWEQTSWEKRLVAIWQELLERNGINRNDNFFRIGGHSLKAIRLISRIQKEFSVKLNLIQVFESPTLSEMAEKISRSVKLEHTEIRPVDKAEFYELSHAQQRLWILNQIERTPGLYNISLTVSIEGKFDLQALNFAFECLVKKYEILRTIFVAVDNLPKQKILSFDQLNFEIEFHDLSTESTGKKSVNYLINNFLSHDFDLSNAPLFRLIVIRSKPEQFQLSFLVHHIITDALSLGIFVNELMQYYQQTTLGKLPSINHPTIQYKDFASWQNGLISSGHFHTQEQYWMNRFADEVPSLQLPYDFVSGQQGDRKGEVIEVEVSSEITSQLRRLADQTNSSLFIVMMASLNALFHRYTGQEDIILGITSVGRNHPDLDNQLGFFINTLPIRTFVNGETTFIELVKAVRANILTAHDNQDYPYDLLVTHLHQKKGRNMRPLFDVLVEYQNKEHNLVSIEGLTIHPVKTSSTISKFNLTYFITEQSEGGLSIEIEYNTNLFLKDTITTLTDRLVNLLLSTASAANTPIHQLNILSEFERTQLEQDGKGATRHDVEVKGLISEIDGIALKFPDRTALHFADAEISYGTIKEESDKLARLLALQYNVNVNSTVPIFMKRSDQLIIALLAVWKAGAAFIPIDPYWTVKRIEFVLNEIGPTVLITESEWLFQLSTQSQHRIIAMDLGLPELVDIPIDINLPLVEDANLAYVMYTSGSTGEPKGVKISVQAITNYIRWANRFYFEDKRGYPFPLFTPLTFDLTLTSLFSTLTRGDELFIYDSDDSYENLRSIFSNHSIKAIKLTPSHLDVISQFLVTDSCIKTFIVGGEPLRPNQIDFLQTKISSVAIYNEYGPTEATVGCTVERVDRSDAAVSIGRAIDNTQIYVLDKYYNRLPRGIDGEIYIAGACLANGYYNRAMLTQERFLKNPFQLEQFPIIYKTGDVGRWMNDGRLFFAGRKDNQIKIRGYRIEAQEIENTMLKYPDVDNAKVIVRSKVSSPYLVVYYTSRNTVDKEYLREFMESYLPSYMIPSAFICIDEFPLTINGKIDVSKLDEVTEIRAEGKVPETNTEIELVQLWEAILEQQPIGVEDDFFELGGNSLKVIAIVERFNQKFPDVLKVSDLFNYSTIKEIAALVDQRLSVVPKDQNTVIEEFEL